MKTKRRLWRDRLAEDMKHPGFRKAFAEAKKELYLAEKIAKAREKARLSQTELARAIGTTQSVISRIEAGEQNTTVETLWKIADATGTSLDFTFRPTRDKSSYVGH